MLANYDTSSTKVFADLKPNKIYNVYAMKTTDSEDPFGADNLLYITQALSDENGNLSVAYGLDEEYDNPLWLVVCIEQTDISTAEVTLDNLTYTGEEQFAEPTVTLDGVTLTEGKEYYLEGDYSAAEPGEYTVIIHGCGLYTGTVNVTYTVSARSISECTVDLGAETNYFRGTRIRPAVTVTDGDVVVTNGSDYTVSYLDNLSVGTAKVVVTGKGCYAGTVTKTFDIIQRSISNCDIEFTQSKYYFTGARIKPEVKVCCNGVEMYSGNYTASYMNNLSAGTATITLTGKNNLKGTVTKTFVINPRSVAACTVTLSENAQDRTHPSVAVSYYGRDIYSGNYTVTYSEMKDGKVDVTITGKNNLTGEITKTYEVGVFPISECDIEFTQAKYYFTGARIRPELKVSYKGQELDSGNYTAVYTDNLTAGTAAVTITGKNILTGTVTKTFDINPRSVSSCTVTLSENTADKNKPTVTVTITGKNNLTGTTTKNYTVS